MLSDFYLSGLGNGDKAQQQVDLDKQAEDKQRRLLDQEIGALKKRRDRVRRQKGDWQAMFGELSD